MLDKTITNAINHSRNMYDICDVVAFIVAGGISIDSEGKFYNVRDRVGKIGRLNIYVYSNDHNPPHFHVIGPDLDCSFLIECGSVLKGDVNGRQERLIQAWFRHNKAIIMRKWDQFEATKIESLIK